jgi:hypothetical protein
MDSFESFLEKKKQAEKPVDWTNRKDAWLKSVGDFYNDINLWLKPFINRSLISIRSKEISVYEQYIGTYNLNQLDIIIGEDIVSLIPRGTLILGSCGRIDMKGPKGDVLIVEPKWDDWKFVKKFQNKRELMDINAESFQLAIQDIVNG